MSGSPIEADLILRLRPVLEYKVMPGCIFHKIAGNNSAKKKYMEVTTRLPVAAPVKTGVLIAANIAFIVRLAEKFQPC